MLFISTLSQQYLADIYVQTTIISCYPLWCLMRFVGLAIPLFHNDPKFENENFRKLTLSLTQLIKDQYQLCSVNKIKLKSTESNLKIHKEEWQKATLSELQTHPNQNQKRLSNIRQEKGVSNWLTVYPIGDQG